MNRPKIGGQYLDVRVKLVKVEKAEALSLL